MRRLHSIRRLLITVLWALLPAAALAQAPHTHQHSFGDAQKWSQVFDDPKRDAWQKLHEVIQALTLQARMAPEQVKAELQRAGYSLQREHAVRRINTSWFLPLGADAGKVPVARGRGHLG
jgi:hypothetical protein